MDFCGLWLTSLALELVDVVVVQGWPARLVRRIWQICRRLSPRTSSALLSCTIWHVRSEEDP